MQKQIAVILVIILFIVVGLCGCSNQSSEENRFVGTWKTEYNQGFTSPFSGMNIIDFFSDGTFTSYAYVGNYEIKDNKLVLTYMGGGSRSYDYEFSKNNTVLTLTPSGGSYYVSWIKQQ